MDTHLLKYHVVDVESGSSVAAFINNFSALMWVAEYSEKVGRALEVREDKSVVFPTSA